MWGNEEVYLLEPSAFGSPPSFEEKNSKSKILISGWQLGKYVAIIRTLLLDVEESRAARLEKSEQMLSSEIHVVKKLNEEFVERNCAHDHTANVAELES